MRRSLEGKGDEPRGQTSAASGGDVALDATIKQKPVKIATAPLSGSDRSSILLLLLLYVLQGIPLGLAGAIPLMLQARKVEYKLQAVFSLVTWPFSVKLLWAPLVDSVYIAAFGRRKSWLVPVQYFLGFFMLFISSVRT